jgi:hypothetical protein
MRLNLLSILSFLALLAMTACGGHHHRGDDLIDRLNEDPDSPVSDAFMGQEFDSAMLLRPELSFLTGEAKINASKLIDKLSALKNDKLRICAMSSPLNQDDKDKINAVRKDNSLGRKEKRAKLHELLLDLRPKMKEFRAQMKKCQNEKAEELKPAKEKFKTIKAACFIAMEEKSADCPCKHKRKHWHGGTKLFKKLRNLSDDKKALLNQKLASAACTEALK